LIITAVLLLLQNCEQPFNPSIDNVGSQMVVEGSISTVPGVHQIKLSLSNPYNDNSKYTGITGAQVFVSDDEGKIISFDEIGQGGVYETDTNEIFKAEIGRIYTLHITTKDGDVYESIPQRIVKCAPIDSLFCEADQQKVMEQNLNGDGYEVVYDGIRVEENTKGLFPNHNFYLYSWKAYEEYRIDLMTETGLALLYTHVKLPVRYDKFVCTGNADDFSDQQLNHNRLLFIPNIELQNFAGKVPDSLLTGGNYIRAETFQGIVFRLEQKSISDNAFLFWSSVQKQLDATGRLFDPVSSQIAGNINCTSDSSKKAFGVFYAYDISERYAFLYISVINRIYSSPMTGFPKLETDSFIWDVPPPGWIFPPF